MAQVKLCQRCGLHGNLAIGGLRRLALLLDGGVSAERTLCPRCLELVLGAVTDAMRRLAA